MERDDTVIELGTASIETRGAVGTQEDGVLRQPESILSDD
ncbi:benenodin family lasso peptide [Novosphingobium clariflavum]|uniref:Benenodin family lasso peptide n=1 Tax=Novosphingobium clariflavum TaxID=2029884 RepID=A0ABV6S1K4_9SPHN|nr:benenodin family lasso peptide [Novosphingobium clariflavum]